MIQKNTNIIKVLFVLFTVHSCSAGNPITIGAHCGTGSSTGINDVQCYVKTGNYAAYKSALENAYYCVGYDTAPTANGCKVPSTNEKVCLNTDGQDKCITATAPAPNTVRCVSSWCCSYSW